MFFRFQKVVKTISQTTKKKETRSRNSIDEEIPMESSADTHDFLAHRHKGYVRTGQAARTK